MNYIHSVETDLNADPLMVRKISELNIFSIISNSDCHTTNFHSYNFISSQKLTILPEYMFLEISKFSKPKRIKNVNFQ